MAKGQKKKTPKTEVEPVERKQPRIGQEPPKFRGGVMAWRFNSSDKNGPFAWSQLDDTKEYTAVMQALANTETMHEADLASQGSHFVGVESLSDAAQERLEAMQLDDLDELYSIRVTGAGRVFCVHRADYMRVLWYDPHHEVCPAKKKHT